MKKHVFKSFALIAMLFSAMTISAQSGVDWSTFEFLGDGAGGGAYANKYKVAKVDGMNVVNIQTGGVWGASVGIYTNFPAAGITCDLSDYSVDGAGMLMHLSSFTAQETKVNVTYATGSCTFWVYYADGTEGGEEGSDTEAPVLESVELFGAAQNFVLLSPNATDNKGVTSYLITPNGGAEEEVTLDNAGKIKIEGLTLDKSYTYSVKAKDAAGNVSAAKEITFSTLDRIFCEEEILPNVQFTTNQKLTFTAKKVSNTETLFTLTSSTSTLTKMFNVNLTNAGSGVLPAGYDWNYDWTLTDNTLSKTVTWETYPTNPIIIVITANRTPGAGEKNLIGLSYSMDISNTCGDDFGDDSGDDSGGSGTTTPTGPSNIDWSNYGWVDHTGYTEYKEQFKVETGCVRENPIQVQNRNGIGIYVTFTKAVKSCSIAESHIEGSGMWVYLSALSARETQVTVTFTDDSTCSFWIYNAHAEVPEEPTADGVCTYKGGPGDGLTAQPGKDLFETGYEVTLQLDNTLENILVTATTKDGPATCAIFQNYYTFIEKEANNEQDMDGASTSTFTKTIPVSWITNSADGIIRFAIKFAYPDGVIKVTTPEFFYLDGSGCAQRVFAIYHHDDLPATPLEGEDQFTEFAGGRILQSIQYKRRMPSEVWETLSVPFDVDSVTAFDPATGKHVLLHAQYNNGSTQEGHYWLRYFKTKEVTASNFQPNWYDIEATSEEAAKPVKDKAYIIRLPNGGGYYNDKYIVFHGRGYQTIVSSSDFEVPELPAEDYYSYSGNNTMMPQYLSSAYVLDNAGYYFTSSSTVTLYPFECSVNATEPTIARMPRIALNGRNNTTTDLTLLPTTDLQGGVIYSIFGAAVARFNTIDEYDQACQNLAAGVYVIVTPSTTTKIQIP